MCKPDDPLLPPTNDEHDKMVRDDERGGAILSYLKAAGKWLRKIKKRPGDIRATPDIRPDGRGGTFISRETDPDVALALCARVRRDLEAGEFELAISGRRDLEGRVRAIQARRTDPLIDTGTKCRAAAARGGRRNPERDLRMAHEFIARGAGKNGLSPSALKAEIGDRAGLKRRAAINAVNRGLRQLEK
jgi:hypothetical protein